MGNLTQPSMADLRIDYTRTILNRADLAPNPFTQFSTWFTEVVASQTEVEANAMTLATANQDGLPSVRIVLLKEFDEQGFVFYTNYESHKGQTLATNPQAALLFYWGAWHRQVRLSGSVSKVSRAESEHYFRSRPHGSKLGAWASHQSTVIASRQMLVDKLTHLEEQYPEGQEVPLPSTWGGYRLAPQQVEFWQGRLNRLHDRFRYTRQAKGEWLIEGLSP